MTPDEPADGRERRTRRDVARNREAILEAARIVFARDGLDAPLDRVARQAGVGGATLYRHFATREDLWEAVLAEPLHEVLDLITSLGDDDPGEALRRYLFGVGEIEARRSGFAALMTTRFDGAPLLLQLRSRIQDGIERLVRGAREAGSIRPDVEDTDFALVAISVARVIDDTGSVAPEVWRRWIALLWDSLSTSTPSALPEPALRPNQVWRALMRNRSSDTP